MALAYTAAGLIFALILLFILTSQVTSLIDCFRAGRRDIAFLRGLPDWRFFAPKPVTGRRHLLVETANGWHEVWSDKGGGAIQIVWNPQRRSSACMYQAESIMINDLQDGQEIDTSVGLNILRFAAASLATGHPTEAYRAAVVMSQRAGAGPDAPQVFRVIVAFTLDSYVVNDGAK